ncbi:tRNA modification GTPase MnmE [Spirochaetia bacterium]|nr:tRNA modification GTPase MnmE [Spirochaetia bacterium]
MKRTYGDTCPIAAQAAGLGALALIRTSGAGSLELLAKVFSRPQKLLEVPGNTVVHGWICKPGDTSLRIDEVLVSVYRSPRSYTGEDGADISCHGGSAAVTGILETLRQLGFQDALPGEFTFRSFMNGKMDLTRCESVMELVSAKTGRGLEYAVKRLSGALEKDIRAIRDTLLEAVSAAELYLDYPEDETGETDDQGILGYHEAAEEAAARLRKLAAGFRRQRLYQEGALAVIAGRPNAGKSSLFNALLNEDRSIVTEIPGTTRDWIEGSFALEGIPLRLADTAGLRDQDEASLVEAQGISWSKTLIDEADIVIYMVDGGEGLHNDDETFLQNHDGPLVLVWNKNDLQRAPAELKNRFCFQQNRRFAELSAINGNGLEALCLSITSLLLPQGAETPVFTGEGNFDAGLGTKRQNDLVQKALLLLEEALSMANREETLDLIAPFLREALDVLGEITGEVSSADILETMFSRFCLGK